VHNFSQKRSFLQISLYDGRGEILKKSEKSKEMCLNSSKKPVKFPSTLRGNGVGGCLGVGIMEISVKFPFIIVEHFPVDYC